MYQVVHRVKSFMKNALIGSNMFDEAYFIVRPDVGKAVKSDFLEEANRIISSRTLDVPGKKQGKLVTTLLFFAGFLSGIGVTFAAVAILL